MGEQTDIPGAGQQSAPPDELDIPIGRKPRSRNDFVAAVEERAALRGERSSHRAAARAARRRSKLLMPVIIGVLVIAAVLAIIYVVMNIGGQGSGDVEQAAVEPAASEDAGALGVAEAPDQDTETGVIVGEVVLEGQDTGTSETGQETVSDESMSATTQAEELSAETESTESDTSIVLYQDDGTSVGEAVEEELIVDDQAAAQTGVDTSAVQSEPAMTEETVVDIVEPSTTAQVEPEAEAVVATVEETTTEQPAQVERLPVRPALSHSGPRVQIAAYGSEQRAQEGWLELRPELGDLLGDHVAVIEEADVNAGIFYRLQIGYFDTGFEARNFCDAVLSRRLDCIVIPQ